MLAEGHTSMKHEAQIGLYTWKKEKKKKVKKEHIQLNGQRRVGLAGIGGRSEYCQNTLCKILKEPCSIRRGKRPLCTWTLTWTPPPHECSMTSLSAMVTLHSVDDEEVNGWRWHPWTYWCHSVFFLEANEGQVIYDPGKKNLSRLHWEMFQDQGVWRR